MHLTPNSSFATITLYNSLHADSHIDTAVLFPAIHKPVPEEFRYSSNLVTQEPLQPGARTRREHRAETGYAAGSKGGRRFALIDQRQAAVTLPVNICRRRAQLPISVHKQQHDGLEGRGIPAPGEEERAAQPHRPIVILDLVEQAPDLRALDAIDLAAAELGVEVALEDPA